MIPGDWNPALYHSSHSFVWEHGRELVALLAPTPGERILDAGCGTGELTAEIARAGASVVGVDSSTGMLETARRSFPELRFEMADVRELPYRAEFDAVFSNAALHWVKEAESAAASIRRTLRPGGRFVAELGGRGNVAIILEAAWSALESLGVPGALDRNPWYFPSVAEYATLLERNALEVTYAALFDRPVTLNGAERGLANWLQMFGPYFMEGLDADGRAEFIRRVEERATPALFRDGAWIADYRRLRIAALATAP